MSRNARRREWRRLKAFERRHEAKLRAAQQTADMYRRMYLRAEEDRAAMHGKVGQLLAEAAYVEEQDRVRGLLVQTPSGLYVPAVCR